MSDFQLTITEKQVLLALARQTIEAVAQGDSVPEVNLEDLPQQLRESGASFVTITKGGELRGCIGALEAYQPLAEDVIEHAAAAATEDWRFPPIHPAEVADLVIEISCLSAPQLLAYDHPDELLQKLRPHIDGVILIYGDLRATFLPQVWEKLADPAKFLSALCFKMGVRRDLWRHAPMEVFTYQVEAFSEEPE